MQEKLIRELELDNGLTMQLLEQSKKVAGDRYFVSLVARMTIPVESQWFGPSDQAEQQVRSIASALGRSVVFEKKMDRNFVDEEEKERIVLDFCHSIEFHTAKYYGHRDFPKKFILQQYDRFRKRTGF
jgi:hypothetical protein